MCRLNYSRIRRIASILATITLDDALAIEEKDPQFIALKKLVETRGCSTAFVIAIANALISYRLTGRGEDYWGETARFFSRLKPGTSLYDAFREFLSSYSRCNKLAVGAKLGRLQKLFSSSLYRSLRENPSGYCRNLGSLARGLARIYRADPTAKTIVFAAKMYGYVCRICSGAPAIDPSIDIPVDRRITGFTLATGMLEIPFQRRASDPIGYAMTRCKKKIAEAWRMVSSQTGIPPLQLDTIIWLLMGSTGRGSEHVEALPRDIVEALRRELRR